MRLVEQFRVRGSDDSEHTIACYVTEQARDSHGAAGEVRSETVYRLNGAESVDQVDAVTFMTGAGRVLRRVG
jgi:hypothetical protein